MYQTCIQNVSKWVNCIQIVSKLVKYIQNVSKGFKCIQKYLNVSNYNECISSVSENEN